MLNVSARKFLRAIMNGRENVPTLDRPFVLVVDDTLLLGTRICLANFNRMRISLHNLLLPRVSRDRYSVVSGGIVENKDSCLFGRNVSPCFGFITPSNVTCLRFVSPVFEFCGWQCSRNVLRTHLEFQIVWRFGRKLVILWPFTFLREHCYILK